MFGARGALVLLSLWSSRVAALRYTPEHVGYNLNENQTADDPHDYWGMWENHDFHKSPENWRFPFYTFFIDRFVNGDPTNDNANGTLFEQDPVQSQLRHGGDLQGFIDSLDYIQGMGMKGLYVAGSPMINQPWGADSYSPLDLTLLDYHFGDIATWRRAVQAVHDRGMYIILDNTMATMGDLIAFEGHLNTSTPFTLQEHQVLWRNQRRQYLDFEFGNTYNQSCAYPRFWLEDGYPVDSTVLDDMKGCYDSEFDQYGDTEAFGVFPDWQRQLSKFASVQDRLREWLPSVRSKLELFTCLQIYQLDIDGFRLDKATQITVDALGDWSHSIRECARSVGKENFFIPGEITGGNTFGSIYIGRGRQPDMQPTVLSEAVQLNVNSSLSYFIRDPDYSGLDSGAFHYSIYRSLARFLGMDGNLAAGFDTPVNWIDAWNEMLITNDFVNANTGVFDPRHMYGVTNQDLFRWPALKNGTEKFLLGAFITTLLLPGIPLVLWGEEQAFYTLDNTASNYIFGRQAMSATPAWQIHGCYKLGSSSYFDFPIEAAAEGCNDEWNSHDHRDPSHPVRNVMKHMYQMRENFPALNDGWFLQQLSLQTYKLQLPGSVEETETEFGLWSVMRSGFDQIQDLSGKGAGNQSVWLLYQNDNKTVNYEFVCNDNASALVAPFDTGTTVRNLFYPYEEYTLKDSSVSLKIVNQTGVNGCLDNIQLAAWEFKALVPTDVWVGPSPMLTNFFPGHDVRVQSAVDPGQQEDVEIEFHYSTEMSCDSIRDNLVIASATEDGQVATLNTETIVCEVVDAEPVTSFVGSIPTTWKFRANLTNVSNGIHRLTIANATSNTGNKTTNSVDTLLFRVGQLDNPIVFPMLANYTLGLLHEDTDGALYVSHKAAGADLFRYSTNWGTTYSEWAAYTGGRSNITKQVWSGTDRQKWTGEHIIMQYYSNFTGSSSYLQHADLDPAQPARRFPHIFAHGPFNLYGYDNGIENIFKKNKISGLWEYYFMTEWPGVLQLNVWGMNPDGQPDQTYVLGDIDLDGVLDRMPPSSLKTTLINNTVPETGEFIYPPAPYLGYRLSINDGNLAYTLTPYGSRVHQMILAFLIIIVPVVTGGLSIWLFMKSFYSVKFNQVGIAEPHHFIPLALRRKLKRQEKGEKDFGLQAPGPIMMHDNPSNIGLSADAGGGKRRTVLIATMEYDIEDWEIKIKIGGLGVMAQLMGKNLGHQDLIWVVPCVGGIDYPIDQPAASMDVTILGKPYEIQVQYHTLRNITYVLLDAPVFRAQSKSEPYPARMDDLDSAVYYSAWNQCVALAIERFPIDLYHINDYHGALAPVHLLPRTIPCCLSLHNAEFQGLWPMRTGKERKEVCAVYNLSEEVVQKYVQFGDVFNLLHAGASYLRIHQKGFGAVGVSKKYGKRSWARYPIFWGLNKIGNLPNPDPSDTGEWTGEQDKEKATVNQDFESNRGELKRQAQEWAGLDQNPKADLLVFVGRWSMQKGIDLIADVMPAVLEENPNVQVICVGPVIDLYGKFAALKLDVMMKKYKGRVFSKPEFTALPPFIFSGAEFALIPSRDEPFGLVAVEFGRKGALGIGARVGGLGQMPGWWYTVESTTTTHLLHQFKMAIKEALASKLETRQIMRARSAKQRFPVAQWVNDLETLQGKAIKIHHKEEGKASGRPSSRGNDSRSLFASNRRVSRSMLGINASESQLDVSTIGNSTRPSSPSGTIEPPANANGLGRKLSLGYRAGPGHRVMKRGKYNASNNSLNAMSVVNEPITDVDEDTDFEDRTMSIYDEYVLSPEELEAERNREQTQFHAQSPGLPGLLSPNGGSFSNSPRGSFANSPRVTQRMLAGQPEADYSLPISMRGPAIYSGPPSPSGENSPGADDVLLPPAAFGSDRDSHRASMLSLSSVVGDKTDFKLQKVDPFFTDTQGEYYQAFAKSLDSLNGKNSEQLLCIEDYLVKSEKKWFDRFRDAKLGRGSMMPPATPSAIGGSSRRGSLTDSFMNETIVHSRQNSENDGHGGSQEENDQFLLGKDYKPPTGLRLFMQYRWADWPVYSFLLAFGQIIAANSYQITLLSGTVGQTAEKLYITAAIYLVSSIIWWNVFVFLKSIYVLSIPFIFYGFAFFLLGMAPFVSSVDGRGWIQNVATGSYAVAAASGSIFFALNFGDEGGSPVKSWVYRACLIQGTQQAYSVALWWWGNYLNRRSSQGLDPSFTTASTTMSAVTVPIAVLMWVVGIIIFMGLPDYYRQKPGKVPSFYLSLFRRKIVMWFFITVVIQNFFLSTLYGRNWMYLFSSNHAKTWQIILLIVFFFGFVWAAFLWFFGMLSKDHSWILPIFAIGLGAPRWCQMLWSCTPIGSYVPWVGSPLGSALFSRAIWLWLGTLDALQGAGFGMMLLQTLTRIHIAFTLIAAQVIGSVVTIIARACAPNKVGPGDVFPDFTVGIYPGIEKAWFWIGLLLQLAICGGFFTFFRKEQLSKP
ncbi:alpha amylase [Phlyctema vagabunda]|uniref:alpha-1,3-glucan synthase n=1 Tax=Phlyctema vagabunda TaxID=108571 RepID=A0ABR4P5I8_9HELO